MKKWVTTLVLLFFAMVMLFQKDAITTQLQFVRNDSESFVNVHNAAQQQRDYLFQDWSGQTTYQGQMNTGAITTTPTETIDSLINPNEVQQVITTTQSGQIYTGTMGTGTKIVQTTETIYTGSLDCITPWNEEVKNKDFVLAYEQRKDVNTICNIQKRVCMSGTLEGTFTQRSCRDDVVYDYHKAEVVSYNQKVLNDYIQPSPAVNAWAEFDNQWQINTTEQPTNNRWTTNNPVTTQPEVIQTPLPTQKSCTAPRGQKIKNGQFVKAYKTPRGFIDLPCDVQIRACVNGNLKGTFTYSKCTFNNTTYTDYLKAGSPTSNTGFLFFPRIKKALRFGR